MKQKFSIITVGLILIMILSACGQFIVEPAADSSADTAAEPNLEATVEAMVAATRAAEIDSETEVETVSEEVADEANVEEPEPVEAEEVELEEQIAEQVEIAAEFMPAVATFNDEASAEWGAAFCPTTVMPICIRPFALETLGNEQVMSFEVWGTGETFAADANNLSMIFIATNSEDKTKSGNDCGNTEKIASHYQAGFGYIVRHCFRSEAPVTAVNMRLNGARTNFEIDWTVGENFEPVGGYDFLINAQEIQIDQPFNVGPATLTIHGVEDLGNAIKLDVTVESNNEKMLVYSPEWLVIGPALDFVTVDNTGVRGEWDAGKMGAYEIIGGEIKAGESQKGSVILTKASADAGLMVMWGPRNTGPDDSKIFVLIQ